MERLLEALARHGLRPGQAVVPADVLLGWVTGHVLAEEAESPAEPIHPEAAGKLPELFPCTFAASQIHDDEAMYSRGLTRLCARPAQP